MNKEMIEKAVENIIKKLEGLNRPPTIGLGSGKTAAYVLKILGEKLSERGIKPIGVPSSSQIKLEVMDYFTIAELSFDSLDLVIDGADQASKVNNYIIKGGGGALTRERILWEMAKERHVFISKEKLVNALNFPLPVEFLPFSFKLVQKRILELGLKPTLRADAKGYPFVTENGNFIFDVSYGEGLDLKEAYHQIKEIPGVVDAGLFVYDVNLYLL